MFIPDMDLDFLNPGSGSPTLQKEGEVKFFNYPQCLYSTIKGLYIIHTEYENVRPFVGIWSTHPLPRTRVCLPPGGTQFGQLERTPGTLYTRLYSTRQSISSQITLTRADLIWCDDLFNY